MIEYDNLGVDIGIDTIRVKDTSGKYVYINFETFNNIVTVTEHEEMLRKATIHLEKKDDYS